MAELKITVKLDNSALGKQANRALDAYAKALDPVLDSQFSKDKWDWPRVTRRRNGEIATSPRNIIDSGDLLNSKVGPTKGQGNAYIGTRKWVWNSPYASLVKSGYITSTGASVPARDWIKAAMNELPFEAYIARFLRK